MFIKIEDRKWIIAALIFALVNVVLISFDFYYFSLLPAIVLFFLLAIFSIDKLFLLAVFFTPLSLEIKTADSGFGLNLPTEPILIGIMVIYLFNLVINMKLEKIFFSHPLTIAIALNLIWIFITCFSSSMPLVSFKYFLSRLWFVTAAYFFGVLVFRNKLENIKMFFNAYLGGFLVVVLITLVKHSAYNFDQQSSNQIMTPFFPDHTSYGAMLAMFLPFTISSLFEKNKTFFYKIGYAIINILLVLALIYSYTRAAWVSLFGATIILICLLFKIKFKQLLIGGSVLLVLVFAYGTYIFMDLEKNSQDSSNDLAKHFQSITNISNDPSNKERINRWSCALRMFQEKPVFGWGPATFMFQYAPFQKPDERTIISTNNADWGGSHSEYLGPLAESGALGLLTYLGIVLASLSSAFRIFYLSKSRKLKLITASLLLGLVTYFTHGFLNFFLDLDKASVPFWGFMAMIVAIDIHHRKNLDREEEITDASNGFLQ